MRDLSFLASSRFPMIVGLVVCLNALLSAAGQGIQAKSVPPADGLVAYYSFDGTPQDQSGNNHNSVGSGDFAFGIDRFGHPGSALALNGGKVQVAGLPISDADGATNTVSLWFNWNGQYRGDVAAMLFAWGPNNLNPPLGGVYSLFFQDQNAPVFGFDPGNGECWGINYDSSLSNRWVHVTALFVNGDFTRSSLFINGEQRVLQLALAGNPESHPQWKAAANSSAILGSASDGRFPFLGLVDDVRLFNRALTPDEVRRLFAGGPCVPHRATATAQVVNGFLVGATIDDPGCGYTDPPAIIIVGGSASGAVATATVQNGAISGITVTSIVTM